MQNNYRYTLTDQLGELAVFPLGSSDFTLSHAKEQDGSLKEYTKTFDGSLIIEGEGFQKLLYMEQSSYRCALQNITIEKRCDNIWRTIFDGSISLNDGEWDLDRCRVTLKFSQDSEAACLSDNDSQKVNVLSVFPKHTALTRSPGTEIETLRYSTQDTYNDGNFIQPDPYWPDPNTDPYSQLFGFSFHEETTNTFSGGQGSPTSYTRSRTTTWVREILKFEVPSNIAFQNGFVGVQGTQNTPVNNSDGSLKFKRTGSQAAGNKGANYRLDNNRGWKKNHSYFIAFQLKVNQNSISNGNRFNVSGKDNAASRTVATGSALISAPTGDKSIVYTSITANDSNNYLTNDSRWLYLEFGNYADGQTYDIDIYKSYVVDLTAHNLTYDQMVQYVLENGINNETVPIYTEPDSTWTNVGSTGGIIFYARRVNFFNQQQSHTSNNGNEYWRIERDFIGSTSASTSLRNGVLLHDVIKLFVEYFCPGLQIKSDFFQFNPDNISNVNYVTNLPSKVKEILLFNGSDVKRPTAGGAASRAEMDWEILTTAIKNMFNVEWRVHDGILRFEHVSYWPREIGKDVTSDELKKWFSGKRKYTHKSDAIPASEEWTWGTKQSSGDFNGYPIRYNNGCVSSTKNKKTYAIENTMTDVELAFANPSSESNVVDDESIFFVATAVSGGSRYILQEAGIVSGVKINNTLALAQLHRDYHRYDRPLPRGIMNEQETVFLSVIPTKQGEAFKIPLCCPNDFNPDDIVKTPLGLGVVESAVYSFKESTLELTLLYDSFDGLEPNNEPVAVFDSVNMYDNSTIDIDVLANDTYQDGDTVEIVIPPEIGSATVTPDNKVRFFVNVANQAAVQTYLLYRIRNNTFGVYSNNARVSINIRKANQPPVANPDTYRGIADQRLTVSAAQGVLANDTDDYGGLFIRSYDSNTTGGGSVSMDPNGAFRYDPAGGYTGSDTFTYVVEDDGGLTAIGTVTINVSRTNVPITVDDKYQVTRGKALQVDNSTYKRSIILNDYNLDGSPVTALAEVKNSSAGIAVTIQANGTFSYPINNVVGKDTFTYTAIGAGGTSTGNVAVQVLPEIRIRLRVINEVYIDESIMCNNMEQYPGVSGRNGDIEVYFTDSNNNPFDVTGLDMYVLIDRTVYDHIRGTSYEATTQHNITGTSTVILPGQVLRSEIWSCELNKIVDNEIEYFVRAADGYIL